MTKIRKKVLHGILFTALGRYSNVLLSIIVGAFLARLLTPNDFGIVSIVTIFIAFFQLLSEVGIGPAIIQNKTLNKKDIESIFSFSIIIGFVFALLFFESSTLVSNFYNLKILEKLCKLLSISVLFYSFNVVPQALCYKNHKFKKIAIITVFVQLFTGFLAVILALLHFSYYSLIIKAILDSFFLFLGNYYLEPVKFSFKINYEAIKKIGKFAGFQFLFNFINYFSRNSDNLLIGKYLNVGMLGYYDKAYKLMLMPVSNLTFVITPVLQPILSDYQNDKTRIYNSYLKVIKLLASIGFPLSSFLFFAAPEIILLLFGPQWSNSVHIFQLLSITVGLQLLLSTSGSIFQAANRVDLLFISGFFSSFLMIGGISFGIFFGKSLDAVGYGLISAFFINFIQAFYILIVKVLNSSFINFFRDLIYPIISAISVAFSLYLISNIKIHYFIYYLILKIITTLICILIITLFFKEQRKILYSIFFKLFNSKFNDAL